MWFILIASLGALILNYGLKGAFGRPRPDLVSHGSLVYSASFPSGHSLMSTAIYLALGALLAVSSCSGGKAPRKGQIMLALQTDMSIPDDVTHVRIIVFKNGALKFDQKYRVGKDGEEVPATLGIIASDNAADTTEVRVLSYQGATVRTLNRAVTTIPQDRIATLRVLKGIG